MRIIKRYSNRKLYDTTEARYITLPQMLKAVRAGDVVKVVDHITEHDLTSSVLVKALEGEQRSNPLPPSGLHRLIREGLAA